MVSVEIALGTVLAHSQPLTPESVSLGSAEDGQILAEPVASDIDSPPFTKSLMDGYAVRASDCQSPPVTLTVIEAIAAGVMPSRTVETRQASRIFTGAAIPDGADAVVPQEWTEANDPSQVTVTRIIQAGQFILLQGKEMRADERVLEAGTILTPQVCGLLASVGKTYVNLFPRPRVVVVSTGSELVEPGVRPGAGQIRNSNGSMLLAQSQRSGTTARYLGIVPDHRDTLRAKLTEAAASADFLILSGGVSVGDHDLIPAVLRDLGVTVHFHQVAMKPGKPLLFGSWNHTLIFGLPGNPISSFVGFELFVRPAIRKRSGRTNCAPDWWKLPLTDRLQTTTDRPTFWPARIERNRVRALPWFGSADLRSLVAANGLIHLPVGSLDLAAGADVPVLAFAAD